MGRGDDRRPRWCALAALVALSACGASPTTATATTEPTTAPRPAPTTAPIVDAGWGEIETSYTGDGPRVAVFGDSITVAGRSALRAELDDRALRIAAMRGEGLSDGPLGRSLGATLMLDAAEAVSADPPDVAVVALGTNDAWQAELTLGAAVDALEEIVDGMGPACIVAVTVSTDATAPDYDTDEAAAINVALGRQADRVADWDAVSDGAGMLQPDSIHPTDLGRRAWAEMVAEAVRGC